MISMVPCLNFYPKFILISKIRGSRIWYLIPYEICNKHVNHKNYIKTKYGYYVYGRSLTGALRWLTDITPQEYYDRFILNITVKSDRPKCSVCNSFLKFISVSHGYGNHGIYGNNKLLFCSKYCKTSYYSRITSYKNINTVESQAKGRRTQFIRQSPDCICYLYVVCWNWDVFKFGITSKYLINRMSWNSGKILSNHIVFRGTRDQVANLEYLIKINFRLTKEYLDFIYFKEFIALIKKLKCII